MITNAAGTLERDAARAKNAAKPSMQKSLLSQQTPTFTGCDGEALSLRQMRQGIQHEAKLTETYGDAQQNKVVHL